MKRFISEFRIPVFIISIILSFSFSTSAQEIVQVAAGEYMTAFRTSNGRLYSTKWIGNTSATPYDVGLSNVIDASGAQYSVVALNSAGEVYVVGISNTSGPYATLVPTDYLGNPFKGNTKVYGLYQCYLTIRDGKVWYWGTGDILNQKGGANITAPIQLTAPSGKTMKKLVATSPTAVGGLTTLWGLATDGTLWQWDRTHTTPFQVSFPGGIAQDITMIDEKAFIVKTATDLFAWGYFPSYAGARSQYEVPGVQSIKAKWEAAGCVFPIKEMVGNANSLHIIDANDNMFASGSMSQGEVGNGQELSPWRTAPIPWNWDWSNGNNMVAPTQIPGKFKNLCSGNTITFYKYVQDMGGNWYSWGRNKSFSLGNGLTLAAYGGQGYDQFPNALNIPAPTLVTPLTQTWTILPFNPTAPRPPFANAGVNQYINTNTTTLYGSGSWQQEGSLTKYEWTKSSGPNATIVSPTSKNTVVNGLTNGTYVFKLKVTNNTGVTASSIVTVVVGGSTPTPPVNQAPTANAGEDQTITLPLNTATLTGTGNDADGTIASYSWVKLSGPTATITSPSSANTTIKSLIAGTYTFELTVKDNAGATATSTVKIVVQAAANQAPAANAGANQTITLPINTATLTGSGNDADGTIASYNWVKLSGPNATITNPSSATTTIKSLVAGVYTFELTVKDNAGATATSTVKITVQSMANQAPTADAGQDQTITLPANTATLTGTGIDTDGTISSYSWVKLSGPTATISSPSSATTTVKSLVAGTYSFQLTVKDNAGATATSTVQIIVQSVSNRAPEANAGTTQTITLPTNSVTLNGSGTDSDGSIAGYTWRKISGPTQANISSPNSASTSVSSLVQGTYNFELSVTDNLGSIGKDTVIIIVNSSANKAPEVNAGQDQSINEPTSVVTLTGTAVDYDGSISAWKWTKTSGPSATINSQNSAQTTISGLTSGVYIFTLSVTDDRGLTASDDVQVTVVRANRNQPPVANAGNDISITLPQNYVRPTGTATDSDGSIVSYKWTKISGPSNFFFFILNSTSPTPTIYGLKAGVYEFKFTVTDNSGAQAFDILTVTVNAKGKRTSNYKNEESIKTSSNNNLKQSLKIYPNPVQSSFTTEITGFDYGEEIIISVTDLSGRTLLKNKIKSNGSTDVLKLDISNFKTGTYFLNATSLKKNVSTKIVKAN